METGTGTGTEMTIRTTMEIILMKMKVGGIARKGTIRMTMTMTTMTMMTMIGIIGSIGGIGDHTTTDGGNTSDGKSSDVMGADSW
jgi:hypothetical protein